MGDRRSRPSEQQHSATMPPHVLTPFPPVRAPTHLVPPMPPPVALFAYRPHCVGGRTFLRHPSLIRRRRRKVGRSSRRILGRLVNKCGRKRRRFRPPRSHARRPSVAAVSPTEITRRRIACSVDSRERFRRDTMADWDKGRCSLLCGCRIESLGRMNRPRATTCLSPLCPSSSISESEGRVREVMGVSECSVRGTLLAIIRRAHLSTASDPTSYYS